LKKLTPDHKTIADFRQHNPVALKQVCSEFIQLCKELELFGAEAVVIDGSKFLAVNSRKRNYNAEKLQRALQDIEEQIAAYLFALEQQDEAERGVGQPTAEQLTVKVEQLRLRQDRYQTFQDQLEQSGERQLSLTDPDSRSMLVRQGTAVCYNVQTAVDSQHHLIVTHEVTNEVTDQGLFAKMARQAKQVLGVEHLEALGDKGYCDGDEVTQCLEHGITPLHSETPDVDQSDPWLVHQRGFCL
jgi:hypothetical protein